VAGAYGLQVSYSAGSAPGYVYSTDNNVYATDVTSTSDATASTGGSRWWTVAALFAASGGSQPIAAVGSPVTASLGSATTYNLSVSPAAGDLLVVYSSAAQSSLSSVGGGGVSAWHSAVSQFHSGAAGASIWWGQASTAGAATLTLTYGAGPGAGTAWVQEYAAGSGTTWSLDTTGDNGYASGAPSTISFAPLTPAATSPSCSGELYVAGAYGLQVSYSAGSAPGYVYSTDNNVYATDVTSTSDATASTGGSRWWTVAALFAASGGSQPIAAVGSPVTASLGSATTYNLSVSPAAGDLLVVYSSAAQSSLSSVGGGGVSAWHSAVSQFHSGAAGASIWWGQASTAGAATLTLTYGAGPGAGTAWVQEYAAGSGTTWSLDTTGDNGYASGAPSTISFAPLTPWASLASMPTTTTTTTTGAFLSGDSKTNCIEPDMNLTDLAMLSNLVGTTYNCVLLFNDAKPDWQTWTNVWWANPPSSDAAWLTWLNAEPGRRLIISQAMVPSDAPSNWAVLGAEGEYDQYATQLAQNLVNEGMGNSIIRLGWEANNPSNYGNALPTDSSEYADWATYWDNIVTAMRAVPGADFQFDWTINQYYQPIPLQDWYPGNNFVNIIGIDAYDSGIYQSGLTAEQRWQDLYNEPDGLAAVAAFAAEHGKPLSIPEWGLATTAVGGAGDDPTYVQGLGSFIATHDVEYNSYFYSANSEDLVYLTNAPLSLAAYQEYFPGIANPA
jgi:hypothetical protein